MVFVRKPAVYDLLTAHNKRDIRLFENVLQADLLTLRVGKMLGGMMASAGERIKAAGLMNEEQEYETTEIGIQAEAYKENEVPMTKNLRWLLEQEGVEFL